MNDFFIRNKKITFLEKPTSIEEKRIAIVMEDYLKAHREQNLQLLISLFDKNARIDSFVAGETVSLDEYIDVTRKTFSYLTRIVFRDLLIRVQDANTAIIYGITCFPHPKGYPIQWNRAWKLAKKDGLWLIVESKYHADLKTLSAK